MPTPSSGRGARPTRARATSLPPWSRLGGRNGRRSGAGSPVICATRVGSASSPDLLGRPDLERIPRPAKSCWWSSQVRRRLGQVDAPRLERDLSSLDAGEVQQVVHQPRQLPALPLDDLSRAPGLLAARRRQSEQVRGVDDGGQRVAELVGEHRQELGLPAVRVTERLRRAVLLGDVEEGGHRPRHLPLTFPQRGCAAQEVPPLAGRGDEVHLGVPDLPAGGDRPLDGNLVQRNLQTLVEQLVPLRGLRRRARGEKFEPGGTPNSSEAWRFPEIRAAPSLAVKTAAGTVSSTVSSSSSVARAPYCRRRALTAARVALTRVRISSGRSSKVTFPSVETFPAAARPRGPAR